MSRTATTAERIADDLDAARKLLGLSNEHDMGTETQTLCVQQSIAGTLIVIATILDHVTRHGERLDVKVEGSGI